MNNKFFLIFFLLNLLCVNAELLDEIKQDFSKKDYKEVIKRGERILKEKEPSDPELNYYLGVSYFYLKKYDHAKKYLEFLIYKTEPENPTITLESAKALFTIYKENKKHDEIVKFGEYLLKKIEGKEKFGGIERYLRNILSWIYGEIGNNFFQRKDYSKAIENYLIGLKCNPLNLNIKEKLAESYYYTGEYTKGKELFEKVIKNEKNNWYLIFQSIYFYREIAEDEEKNELLSEISDNPLSYKIFKSFEEFSNGNFKDGFEILKDEEEKRKTNGNITFNIINKIFPYNFSSKDIYFEFVKTYPSFPRNEWILRNIIRNIRDEKEREDFERKLDEMVNFLLNNEKNKEAGIKLKMGVIEAKFERKLLTIDDYIDKINEYKNLLNISEESKQQEEIMRRIGDLFMKIEDYQNAREIYMKMIDLFKKENYYVQIGECYLKEGEIDKAYEVVQDLAEKGNENARLILAKIYINKGEKEKGFKILKEIEKSVRSWQIKKEIEEIKNRLVEIKELGEIKEDYFFIIFRKVEENITRLSPENNLFLRYPSEEIEFYPFSVEDKKLKFKLKAEVNDEDYLSKPYIMLKREGNNLFFEWKDEICAGRENLREKKNYRIFYPVKEKKSEDFKIKVKTEKTEGKLILTIEFDFLEEGWEINLNNYRRYGRPLKIEPDAEKEEGNNISWKVDEKNFKIKISYPENPNIVDYLPEIEIKKEKNEEIVKDKIKFPFKVGLFEIKIDDFHPEKVKILKKDVKIYTIKERIF